MILLKTVFYSIHPVSYTHLDVYKRQDTGRVHGTTGRKRRTDTNGYSTLSIPYNQHFHCLLYTSGGWGCVGSSVGAPCSGRSGAGDKCEESPSLELSLIHIYTASIRTVRFGISLRQDIRATTPSFTIRSCVTTWCRISILWLVWLCLLYTSRCV